VTKEVIARAGGEDAVGATARKFGLFGDTMAEAATSNPEAVLERTRAAIKQVGDDIGGKLQEAGEAGASAKASDILAPLKKQIADLESTTAGAQKAGPLRQFHDEMAAKLGLTTETVPKTSEEVRAWMQANAEAVQKSGNKGLPREAFQNIVQKDADVPLERMVAERRALQQNVYQYTKSLNAPLHIEELRKFAGAMGDMEEQAMNRATSEAGGAAGTDLRALNKDYQRLKLIERATEERVATQATNQRLSLTDKMFGAAHVAGALASGHPLTAAMAAGTSLGSKLVRERGNAMASMALGKLAKLDMLARASDQVDSRLTKAFDDFANRSDRGRKVAAAHLGASEAGQTPRERYDRARNRVPAMTVPDVRLAHVDRAIPELSTHAPKVALATAQTVAIGSAYLAAKQPKAPGIPDPLGRGPQPSAQQMSAYTRQAHAVNDPVGTVERGLATGKIHADEIDAIAASKPAMYAKDIQQPAIDLAMRHGKELGYAKIQTLSRIAKVPLDPSLRPDHINFVQSTFVPPAPSPHPGAMPSSPKRQIKGLGDSMTLKAGSL
jgi:hypothetical protein